MIYSYNFLYVFVYRATVLPLYHTSCIPVRKKHFFFSVLPFSLFPHRRTSSTIFSVLVSFSHRSLFSHPFIPFSTSFSLHIPELSPPFLFLHIIFSVFSVFLSRINRAPGKAAEREAITSLPRQSPRRFGSLFIGLLSLDLAACHQSQCIRS